MNHWKKPFYSKKFSDLLFQSFFLSIFLFLYTEPPFYRFDNGFK